MHFLKTRKTPTIYLVTIFFAFLAVVTHCSPIEQVPDDIHNLTDKVSAPACDRPICKHWELVANISVEDTLPVYKFRSKRTGIIIVLASAESPIVNGYFCLSTEAFNNDGLPHTLEHLIFLGR